MLMFSLTSSLLFAQGKPKDSIAPKSLNEVIVIGEKAQLYKKQMKSLATIDE